MTVTVIFVLPLHSLWARGALGLEQHAGSKAAGGGFAARQNGRRQEESGQQGNFVVGRGLFSGRWHGRRAGEVAAAYATDDIDDAIDTGWF